MWIQFVHSQAVRGFIVVEMGVLSQERCLDPSFLASNGKTTQEMLSATLDLWLRFEGALAKIAKSDYELRHVCPSVRIEQLGSYWRDLHDILYLSTFRKSVGKTRSLLKSGKNNRYFTWRPMDILYHISFRSSWNEKWFRQKWRRKSKHNLLSLIFFFAKVLPFGRQCRKIWTQEGRGNGGMEEIG